MLATMLVEAGRRGTRISVPDEIGDAPTVVISGVTRQLTLEDPEDKVWYVSLYTETHGNPHIAGLGHSLIEIDGEVGVLGFAPHIRKTARPTILHIAMEKAENDGYIEVEEGQGL